MNNDSKLFKFLPVVKTWVLGKRMATNKICGVSILRAGETMEQAVCDVCKDIRIGKILIQTNQNTGEPEVSNFSITKRTRKFITDIYFSYFT